MAYQKGLNKNRNHHDSLSQSGGGRTRHDNHGNNSIFDRMANFGVPQGPPRKNDRHPNQKHW